MRDTSGGDAMVVQEVLPRLDVDLVGVASVAALAEPRLREQVTALLPDARSIVAVGMEIYSEVLDLSGPTKVMGEAAPRDLLVPHMDYLSGRLNKAIYDVGKACRRQGFKALPMPAANYPTDHRYLTSILSYKHAAVAAGLGTLGRHSLLITPAFGARVRLACLITDAELRPSARQADSPCNGCVECITACPAGALSDPGHDEAYSINKFACQAFRAGSGACSECMRVCPQGR
jgi:epoxyqueuosine reductase